MINIDELKDKMFDVLNIEHINFSSCKFHYFTRKVQEIEKKLLDLYEKINTT